MTNTGNACEALTGQVFPRPPAQNDICVKVERDVALLASIDAGWSPLSESASTFNIIAERTISEERVLNALGILKPALLSVLLTGEVRVKPDEEPA